jgi:hypothetical protein
MKRLLLALLVCVIAITAIGQAPSASADCIYLRYYYYEYWGGPSCGYTYQYCEATPYHSGCETQYYDVYGGCACP